MAEKTTSKKKKTKKKHEKKIWERENPKQHSTPLTKRQKSAAKKSARRHGRDQPSLVDNINAKRSDTPEKAEQKSTTSKK